MGKMQRNKGSRVERLLRDHLRDLGHRAERVPLSGASKAYKGDVLSYIGGKPTLFECKAKKDGFDRIYALYANQFERVCAFHNLATGMLVAFSEDFEALRVFKGSHQDSFELVIGKTHFTRTVNKVIGLYKLLGEAEYLVIKGDHKPFLFFKFTPPIEYKDES